MKISVLKFGGSTFQSLQDYWRIAEYLHHRIEGNQEKLVVVTSAFLGLTEKYRQFAQEIHADLSPSVTTGLLPLADTMGAQLLCHAILAEGMKAGCLTDNQIGITTSEHYLRANVLTLNPANVLALLETGDVVVIPGGQGATPAGRLAWLGKNSADYSAILIAKMLQLKKCEIFSDVPGIYSSDPTIIKSAKLLSLLPYQQVFQLSLGGAKVLHYVAVQCAEENDIEIICRRNRNEYEIGTRIGFYAPANMVCFDLLSRTFEFVDQSSYLKALVVLQKENLPVINQVNQVNQVKEEAWKIVVTCGHSMPEKYLKAEGIEFIEREEGLMTLCLAEGSTEWILLAKENLLVEAKYLHAQYYNENVNDNISFQSHQNHLAATLLTMT